MYNQSSCFSNRHLTHQFHLVMGKCTFTTDESFLGQYKYICSEFVKIMTKKQAQWHTENHKTQICFRSPVLTYLDNYLFNGVNVYLKKCLNSVGWKTLGTFRSSQQLVYLQRVEAYHVDSHHRLQIMMKVWIVCQTGQYAMNKTHPLSIDSSHNFFSASRYQSESHHSRHQEPR